MAGPVELQIRTEPSFRAAAALMGAHPQILLARQNGGPIAGLGVRTERNVLLNGQTRRIGHLSFLRVAPAFRGRRDFLRNGFGLLRDLQDTRPVEFCTTAILAENRAARRLLEARLPGMPVYQPIADVATFAMGVRRRAPGAGAKVDGNALREFLQAQLQAMPLAPVVSLSDPSPVPALDDFVTVENRGHMLAAAAIWDQRPVRQTILTRYAAPLRYLRPLYNLAQGIRGRRGLPPPGPLNIAYVSHLAVEESDPLPFAQLLANLHAVALARGIDYLILSLAADHPLAWFAARSALHCTRSTLYTVRWPDQPAPRIPSTTPYVEAALL
jgi:hypothetical protein